MEELNPPRKGQPSRARLGQVLDAGALSVPAPRTVPKADPVTAARRGDLQA